jgi:hypothetical protein
MAPVGFQARILPSEEWARLDATPLAAVRRQIDSHETDVVVVESDGAIVGCWMLTKFWHVEGVWIRPDHQKRASVAKRLLGAMTHLCRRRGAHTVMTGAADPVVRSLVLDHLGAVPLPDQFAWSIAPKE